MLDHVVLTPVTPNVQAGGNLGFNAQALDKYNQAVASDQVTYAWTTDDSGKLSAANTASVTYTADQKPGSSSIQVVVTQQSKQLTKSATTNIAITPSPEGYLDIHSDSDEVTSGEQFGLTITAYNGDGTIDKTFTGPVSLSDSTQTITPHTTVQFTNGIWTGKVEVNSADASTVINGAGNKRQGVSANIKIKGKHSAAHTTKGGVLGAAYNVVADTGQGVAEFFNNFLRTSASYPEQTKTMASAAVAILGFFGASWSFGRTASKAIEAIGRNPYARRKIMLSLGVSFIASMGFACLAFLIASFIKFM